jgi:hypothetical protein
MRFHVRARIVLASLSIAAASILSFAATVLADTGPIPFPK